MLPLPPLRRLFRLAVALLALAHAGVGKATAQQQAVPEHDLKAAFVYNFIQFTQWPVAGSVDGGTLNVCAGRASPLFTALQGIAGKLANGRPIALYAIAEVRPELCHVLVVGETERAAAPLLLRQLGNSPVLTVTDDAELAQQGTMIGMSVEGGRIAFSIDNVRAQRAGLAVSSRLLRLARSVR